MCPASDQNPVDLKSEPKSSDESVRGMIVGAATFLIIQLMLVQRHALVHILIDVGAMAGFAWQSYRGKRGIVGSVCGGMVVCILSLAFQYLDAYLHPQPNLVDYIGPSITLIIAALLGMFEGGLLGLCMWGFGLLFANPRQ